MMHSSIKFPATDIYVVDDCRDDRLQIIDAVALLGCAGRPFVDAEDVFAELGYLRAGIFVIGLGVGANASLDLLRELVQRDCYWPVVITSRDGDIPKAVKAIQMGAIDFVVKPVELKHLASAIKEAVKLLPERSEKSHKIQIFKSLFSELSPRQRQVFCGVARGQSNREIALQYDLSVRTVESYRLAMKARLSVTSTAGIFDIRSAISDLEL